MATISKGDVVIAAVPQGRSFKVHPVVVVQSDRNNGRLSNTNVVMVTSNTRLASTEATQVLIDVTTSDDKRRGLLSLQP